MFWEKQFQEALWSFDGAFWGRVPNWQEFYSEDQVHHCAWQIHLDASECTIKLTLLAREASEIRSITLILKPDDIWFKFKE